MYQCVQAPVKIAQLVCINMKRKYLFFLPIDSFTQMIPFQIRQTDWQCVALSLENRMNKIVCS